MEALLGFDLDLWDYPTFLTLMLCVVALIATWLVLAGLLPTVYPRMQALIWAFKPTDIVDIRRFPPRGSHRNRQGDSPLAMHT
jgi:uncharacterized membrane protein